MTTEHSETPAHGETERPGSIVVGIDGSPHSERALEWAARQAKLSGASLRVIITWEFPTSYGAVIAWPVDINMAADAKTVLDQTIEEVLGSKIDIPLTSEVVEGHAALILERESRSASLLVVGSRGHGEFAGMLLGSVSEFLATHAHCPLVIVRDDQEKPAAS